MLSLNEFHDLVQASEGELRAFIAGWGIAPSEVDDLAQEAFLSFFEEHERRPAEVSVIAWLKGIARNHCRDHVRRKDRHRRHLEELGLLLRQHRATCEQVTDEEQSELRLHLQECLGELAEEQRALIIQRYVHGCQTEEIARRSGRRAGTLRMVLMRVRAVLRDCLRHKADQQRKRVS